MTFICSCRNNNHFSAGCSFRQCQRVTIRSGCPSNAVSTPRTPGPDSLRRGLYLDGNTIENVTVLSLRVTPTPNMQCAPDHACPRCRTPLASSPCWLTRPSLGLAGSCTSATTQSKAWPAAPRGTVPEELHRRAIRLEEHGFRLCDVGGRPPLCRPGCNAYAKASLRLGAQLLAVSLAPCMQHCSCLIHQLTASIFCHLAPSSPHHSANAVFAKLLD
jgi:hypothetical protein